MIEMLVEFELQRQDRIGFQNRPYSRPHMIAAHMRD